MEELEASLETRLSVAGAASSAVKVMNDNERNAFQQSCYQRRQETLNALAWDFRNVSVAAFTLKIHDCVSGVFHTHFLLALVHAAASFDETQSTGL